MAFLHDRGDFKKLIDITARAEGIDDPSLVEKDYWIMHCLYGLQISGLQFELKGGTSLSKGYKLIDRFSEDIDIRIEPDKNFGFEVFSGKNHDKPKHIESRQKFFEWLAEHLSKKLPGLVGVEREKSFDDQTGKFRNGGIRLHYKSEYPPPGGLKEGVLLEVGFDRTAPNQVKTITSWIFNQAKRSSEKFDDNEAKNVPCYEPKYTFVEKLQAVVKKYRQFKEGGSKKLPLNFLRHYYDLFKLIDLPEVQEFIGTKEYEEFKLERFHRDDAKVANSGALRLSDPADLELFINGYQVTKALYFRGQPSFQEMLKRFEKDINRL